MPPPATSPSDRFRAGILVGAVVGAVAAAVVMALLMATGALGAGSQVDGDQELTLPTMLGDLVTESENATLGEEQPEVLASLLQVQEETAENWSAAYDGASATAARYVDEDLLDNLVVIAVAAPSPGLAHPSYNQELTRQLELPPVQVLTYDEVECLVTNRTVVQGQPVPDDATRVTRCQRSDDDLTVVIESVTGDVANDPERVAGYVDEVFAEL